MLDNFVTEEGNTWSKIDLVLATNTTEKVCENKNYKEIVPNNQKKRAKFLGHKMSDEVFNPHRTLKARETGESDKKST